MNGTITMTHEAFNDMLNEITEYRALKKVVENCKYSFEVEERLADFGIKKKGADEK